MAPKNKHPAASEVETVELDVYYESVHNQQHPGCSLTYSVRNFSDRDVRVRGRLGYCQIVAPRKDGAYCYGDHACEKNSVWLDVKFTTSDPLKNFPIFLDHGNKIDKAIFDQLSASLSEAIKNHREGVDWGSVTCTFGIRLNSTSGNLGNNSYISETLGVIIDLDTSELSNVYLDGFKGNEEDRSVLKDSNYRIIRFVDNTKEFNSLWTMNSGVPSKVKSVVDLNSASGLYVYTNELYTKASPYQFVPITEINDDKLREYGLSYTEKELIDTQRTKEYVEMVKNYEKQIADLKALLVDSEIAREKAVSAVEISYEKRICDIEVSHKKELAQTKATYSTQIDDIIKWHENRASDVEKAHNKDISALNKSHNDKLTEINKSHNDKLTEAHKSHTIRHADLIREHEKEIKMLEASYKRDIRAMGESLNDFRRLVSNLTAERDKFSEKYAKAQAQSDAKDQEIHKQKINAQNAESKYFRRALERAQSVIMGIKLLASIFKPA